MTENRRSKQEQRQSLLWLCLATDERARGERSLLRLSRARRRKAKPEEEEAVRQLLAVCAREKRKGDKGSANECRAELAQAMPKYRANESKTKLA